MMRIHKLEEKFMRIPASLKESAVSFTKENWQNIILFASILLYGVIFSYYTLLKHYSFNSYAWDLGIFNQALYTTLFYGKLLYYTADQFLNPSGSYLAFHFSPILFVLLPFYAIYPSAETLLVIKSFLLALGALPLFLLAKDALKSDRAALMFAIAYLLHPAIQGSNWFDFQQQVFIPILIFFSVYFMNREKWKLYFLTLMLSLMISEHTTLLILALSTYYLLTSNLRRIPHLIKKPRITREIMMLLTVILCILFFYISESIKNLFPIRPEFLEVYKATSTYSVLGFKGGSLLSLVFYVLLNPNKSIEALLYDYPIKLLYIIFLFAPLAFLPFGSKITVVSILLLLPFLLSNYPAYYKIGAHYPLYVITPIFLAAIDTLSKRTKRDIESTLKIVLVASLLLIISTSPISPVSRPLIEQNILWYPMPRPINEDLEALHKILDLIPKDASVLTQSHIFPHVSNRIDAYVLPPYVGTEDQMKILKAYVKQLINKSDYIFLEIKINDYWTKFTLNEIKDTNLFNVYAFSKWAFLFKKDYAGPALMVGPAKKEVFEAYKDLYLKPSVRILVDESSKSGLVAFYPKNSKEDIFVYGPYTSLPKGIYNVTCTIKFGPHSEGYLATFDVADEIGEVCLARKDLYGFEIKPNVWNNITLTFAIKELRTNIEFRVSSTGVADVYVDRVILKHISSEVENSFGTLTFNYRNLKINGEITEDRILLRSAQSKENPWSFWFGPYISLPPGKYRVTFNLKVNPAPSMEDKIIMLEVVKDHGANIMVSMNLYGKNILENQSSSGWCKITLEFSTETWIREVEFRGVDPSKKYDIYLAYILLEKIH